MATDFKYLRILLSNIRKYGTYSDLTILCESSIFRVHRCIVCSQSNFFDKAINGRFQEATTGQVALEDDPRIVAKMIDYLYCADYEDCYESSIQELAQGSLELPKSEEEQTETSSIEEIAASAESDMATVSSFPVKERRARINAEIYILADKYQIEGLKILAKQKMESCLQLNWTDTEFINTVQYVYGPNSPSHSELRDILSRSAIQHLSTLEHQQHFHETLKNFTTFSYDFSSLMIKKVLQLEQELCNRRTTQILWQPTVIHIQERSRPHYNVYCSVCKRHFVDRRALRQHDTDSHYWCTDCGVSFSSISKARSHRANSHGGF